MHAEFEFRRLKEELCVDVGIILKWIIKKCDMTVWTSFISRRIGTNDGML
jgi:hypothetical protein